MNSLKSISIRARMTLALGLIMLLFASFALFSISEMKDLGQVISEIYEHPLRVSNAALRAESGIIQMHRGMKDVVLAETSAEMHDAVETVREKEEEVYRQLQIIQDYILGDEGKALIEETSEMFAGWKPIRAEVQRLVAAGDDAAAARITRGKGAEYVDRLERQMRRVNRYAQEKADGFIERANALQARLLGNTILAIAGVALLCVGIGYFMIVSILPDILTLRNTMAAIVTTGELQEAAIPGDNEIAEMGRHFNALIDKLRDYLWVRDAQMGLNQTLISPGDYDELAERVVDYVARCAGASSGAVYECDGVRKVCVLRASYAVIEGEHFAKQFAYREGIVGQVAADGKAILLEDTAPRTDSRDRNPLSVTPRSICAVPLAYEGLLYGVLEIATAEPLTAAQTEFIETAARSISTALCAAAQKQRIEELLKTTRTSNETLERQSVALKERTEELHMISEQLQARNAELEEANRLKADFMSNISHELRTPLNSVMALSRVLKKRAAERNSREEEDYLHIIEQNGGQLLELIDDILDLARIESGRMELKPKPLYLTSVIDSVMDNLEPLAEEKGLRLRRDVAANVPRIVTDEKCVFQILRNLLGNAVKFTEHGSITVTAKRDDDSIVLDVADTGIGIAPEALAHVFEKFWQADVTLSSEHDGAGLGLTIAYETAQLLGGKLSVSSTPGKGSTFCLRLPIERQADAAASKTAAENGSFHETRI